MGRAPVQPVAIRAKVEEVDRRRVVVEVEDVCRAGRVAVVRRAHCADHGVRYCVAVQVAERGKRAAEALVDAVDLVSLRAQLGEIDGRQRVRLPEDDVRVVGALVPDELVGSTVPVDIAGIGDRVAGERLLRRPVNLVAPRAERREIDRRAVRLAEDEIDLASVRARGWRIRRVRRGDEHVIHSVAVDVSGRGDGAAGVVAEAGAVDAVAARAERGQVDG